LVFIALVTLLGLYSRPFENTKPVPLSEVASQLQSGHVQQIQEQDDQLTITLKNDPTKLTSQKESGVSLTDTLKNLGVSQDKLAGVTLSVDRPSGIAFWASTLLPIILPFILLGAFLWFMMRSAQVASNRAMTFGQMPSRPLTPSKRKPTMFSDVAGNDEAKNELQEVVEFLKSPQKFQRLG